MSTPDVPVVVIPKPTSAWMMVTKELSVAGIILVWLAIDYFKIDDPELKYFLLALGLGISGYGGILSTLASLGKIPGNNQ